MPLPQQCARFSVKHMDERKSVAAVIERLVKEANVPDERARDELRRELESHFEESGSSPDAVRAALSRFGSTEQSAKASARRIRLARHSVV